MTELLVGYIPFCDKHLLMKGIFRDLKFEESLHVSTVKC